MGTSIASKYSDNCTVAVSLQASLLW